jgi:hypothetical protein
MSHLMWVDGNKAQEMTVCEVCGEDFVDEYQARPYVELVTGIIKPATSEMRLTSAFTKSPV